jgi:hypothetical protein
MSARPTGLRQTRRFLRAFGVCCGDRNDLPSMENTAYKSEFITNRTHIGKEKMGVKLYLHSP